MEFRKWAPPKWIISTNGSEFINDLFFDHEIISNVFEKPDEIQTFFYEMKSERSSVFDVLEPLPPMKDVKIRVRAPNQAKTKLTTLQFAVKHHWCTFVQEKALEEVRKLDWVSEDDAGLTIFELADDSFFDILLPKPGVHVTAELTEQVNDILYDIGKEHSFWERPEGF